MKTTMKALALAASLMAAWPTAQAQQVYGGVNLFGVTVGYAHPVNDRVTLRGDLNGGASYSRDDKQGGVEYAGKAKAQFAGIYADWFPTSTGFRLTGGLTVNDIKVTLDARPGANANATINNIPVNISGDRMDVMAKFPSATPYLGIGWGHKLSSSRGWGFYADLGVMIGKFKIKTVNQNITTNHPGLIAQSDIDAEVAKAQKDLNKLSVLPVLGLGVVYRF